MKRSTFAYTLLLLLLGAVPLEGAPRFVPRAVSQRKIIIGKQAALTLIDKGKVNFEVVKPATPAAMPAAQELLLRLSEIAGTKLAMVPEASGKVPAFYVGESPESRAAGLDPSLLDRDGFFIKTSGSRIFITGVDSDKKGEKQWASLFGVFDFLERFAGVRYYFPGKMGTIVPRKQTWQLPEIDIAERPDTQYRQVYCYRASVTEPDAPYHYPGHSKAQMHPKSWRNSSLSSIRSCHGLNDLELSKRFRKTHPEIFALRPDGIRRDGTDNTMSFHKYGHLCYSSPKLLEIVCADAEAALTGKPASSRGISYWRPRWNTLHVNPTPNDGLLWCQCPPCKKIQAQGKEAMCEHIWRFYINIARFLKEKKIPGSVIVDSYGIYSGLPAAELPDNITVSVAVTGPWGMRLEKIRKRNAELIAKWHRRMGTKLNTWTYPTKASAAIPIVPNFTPRGVSEFYKSQKDKIIGGFFEAGSDRWIYGFLNAYVYSKVLWDFNTDTEALIAEHCRLMYGKGAPFMNKFYQELEDLWTECISKETVATAAGDFFVMPTRMDLWTKIVSPKRIARINALLDQAEKAVKNDAGSLEKCRFMRSMLWEPVVMEALKFSSESRNRSAWTLQAGKAEKITLDGKLDEAEWKKAAPVYLLGSRWQPVKVHTKVRALADKEYLYFGFEADEPETEKMVALTSRRPDSNEIWMDNGLEIFLSEKPSSNFIYQFIFNSAGSKSDLKNSNIKASEKYDSGFEVKISVVPGKNYTAELRIPWKSLPELVNAETLMVNFTRHRLLKGMKEDKEFYHWFPKKRNIAENCGFLRLAPAEKEKNLIKTPDFNKKILRQRFIGGGDWAGTAAVTLDKEIFLTQGSALLLTDQNNSIRQNLPLEPGKSYVLSFYIKTEDLSPGFRGIIRFGGAPAPARYILGDYRDYIRGTNNWFRVEKRFKAPGTFGKKHPVMLDLFIGKSKGKCWIDHVKLVCTDQ